MRGTGNGRRGAILWSMLLVTSVMFALPATSTAAIATCDGVEVTIQGTPGDDVLIGTPDADVINGGAGNDVIKGLDGNDIICGGAGFDELRGGNGADRLLGGKHADSLFGLNGHDTLLGGAGSDLLNGGKGSDTLSGGAGPDNLTGGPGNDNLAGHGQDDVLIGGTGTDELNGNAGFDRCAGNNELNCEANPIDFRFERFLISQAVPQEDSDLPPNQRVGTVASRPGIVRFFMSANQPDIPSPEVHLFYRQNGQVTRVPLAGPAIVPQSPDVANLASTYNYTFDETLLEPGTEMYVKIDRLDEVFELKEGNNRYPQKGWRDINTQAVPRMRVTVVPITIEGGAAANISLSQARALYEKTLKVHPVGESNIQVRDNYLFQNPTGTTQDWITLLQEMAVLQQTENPNRQYHAFLPPGGLTPGIAGIGYIGFPAAVSIQNDETIAHETGHNLSLPHVTCTGQEGNPDPNYPYPGGGIGNWGYDIITGVLYDPAVFVDLMTYCQPEWVSDYNFANVLAFRTGGGWELAGDAAAGSGTVVQFMGNVPATGWQAAGQSAEIALPAAEFTRVEVVDRPAVPPAPGDHTLRGLDAAGNVVTSASFQTYAYDHADGAMFIFSIEIADATLAKVATWTVDRGGEVIVSRAAD